MNDNKLALVINESASMRKNVMSILSNLRQSGDLTEILEAESPDHALRLLLQHDGKLQFIVSGWKMPGMPLAEFLQVIQFQPRLAGAPLLIITEEGNREAKTVAKEVGATAILTTPLDPERLLVLTMAVTGTVDRRRTKRITPFVACEIEVGFSKAKKTSSAVVVNISETGILLRTPVPPRGVGYVYDEATLVLRPVGGSPISVSAQILRVEAETKDIDSEKMVLIAFKYQKMDNASRKLLGQYLQINDLEKTAAS